VRASSVEQAGLPAMGEGRLEPPFACDIARMGVGRDGKKEFS